MKKATVELRRDFDHIKGYGTMRGVSEQQALDFLVEWSKPNIRIYRHLISTVEENVSTTRFYEPECDRDLKIPYCELVFYIDIYYEENHE